MCRLGPCLLLLLLWWPTHAQSSVTFHIYDLGNGEDLPGANIKLEDSGKGQSTDGEGMATFTALEPGALTFEISFIGYRDTVLSINIPPVPVVEVSLEPLEESLAPVTVSSTRTNARIEDVPLKVEVLGSEDMDEEGSIAPGNIASLLHDLSVITIQHTNAINGNTAVRMQGLDPEYTLITRDGLPLYGGFSGSLGVLDVPPLDLKQIEIIKGSVSTLYGGGAIAGMINILSKEPGTQPTHDVLFNVTTLNEKNLNSFFSGKLGEKTGYTLFAGTDLKTASDINHDGMTEVPGEKSFTLHPRIFESLGKRAKLNAGITTVRDLRISGDRIAVREGVSALHPYLRKESSLRNVTDLTYTYEPTSSYNVTARTAISIFNRHTSYPYRDVPGYQFNGTEYDSYAALTQRFTGIKHTLVTGADLITSSFRQISEAGTGPGDYGAQTIGLFVQDDWHALPVFTAEAGLRGDWETTKGWFLLPRIALFYHPTKKLSLRLASGAGYRTPNILSESDPTPYLVNNRSTVASERSTGVNADINYRVRFSSGAELTLNEAVYYALIHHPTLVVTDTVSRRATLETQPYHIVTTGADTYATLLYKGLELYLGYNHTEALRKYNSQKINVPFNPRDKISMIGSYGDEDEWRVGLEASLWANQYAIHNEELYAGHGVIDSHPVPDIPIMAAMIERKFGICNAVLNVENLLNKKQSDAEPLFDGPLNLPAFRPVWGPVEGRVFNLSLKLDW